MTINNRRTRFVEGRSISQGDRLSLTEPTRCRTGYSTRSRGHTVTSHEYRLTSSWKHSDLFFLELLLIVHVRTYLHE